MFHQNAEFRVSAKSRPVIRWISCLFYILIYLVRDIPVGVPSPEVVVELIFSVEVYWAVSTTNTVVFNVSCTFSNVADQPVFSISITREMKGLEAHAEYLLEASIFIVYFAKKDKNKRRVLYHVRNSKVCYIP